MGSTINTTAIWNMVHRVGFFTTQVFGSWICVRREAQWLLLSWASQNSSLNHKICATLALRKLNALEMVYLKRPKAMDNIQNN
jgi:hypothetical protein